MQRAYSGIQFEEHHIIKYFCIDDCRYYGELQPATKIFYIKEGEIHSPEREWPIKQQMYMPNSWTNHEGIPEKIHISHQTSDLRFVFQISYLFTKIPPRDIGKVFGSAYLVAETLNL
jgi:hypothetical protein